MSLPIRTDACAFDFLSLGALVHRLDPGVVPFRKARSVDIHVAGGVRWFHSGGIFAALSETTSELIIEGMRAAKATGAIVSFDLNFRGKLWKSVGGEKRAVEVMRRIVANVDCLVGNEEDMQKGL